MRRLDIFFFRDLPEYRIDDLCLLIAREAMHSREEWEIVLFAPLGYFFVGEHHELLDQLMGIIAFPFFDIDWSFLYSVLPSTLEVKIYFSRLECDFPFFSSAFFEDMIESCGNFYGFS